MSILKCSKYNNNLCVSCYDFYRPNSNGSGCCPPKISYCSKYSIDCLSCSECSQGYQLNTDNTKCFFIIDSCVELHQDFTCKSCKDGKISVNQNKICALEIPDCLFYQIYRGKSFCRGCITGKALTSDYLKCITPIENCMFYSNDFSSCSICYYGKILTSDGKICYSPITYCSIYSENYSNCKECTKGKILNSARNFCYTNIPDCQNYSSRYSGCMSCSTGKVLTYNRQNCYTPIKDCDVYSVDYSECKACSQNFVLATDNKSCIIPSGTIKNCLNYSNDKSICNACEINYIKINNTLCVMPIPNCSNYSNDQNCSSCVTGKVLSSNKRNCYTPIDNCSIPDSNKIACVTCSNGFALTDNFLCAPAIKNCKTYSSDKICKSCNDGFTLSNTNKSCIMPIKNCSLGTDDSKCLNCDSSYSLQDGKCVKYVDFCQKYSDSGVCISCDNEKFPNSDFSACISPTVNIPNCVYYSTDGSLCKNCKEGWVLKENSCVGLSLNISNCKVYLDNTKCQTCQENYTLSKEQDACMNNNDNSINFAPNLSSTLSPSNNFPTPSNNFSVSSDNLNLNSTNSDNNISSNPLINTNPIPNPLINSIQNCITYSENKKTCEVCSEKFYLSQDKTSCLQIIPGCELFSNDGLCASCLAGKILSLSKMSCLSKIDNCEEYSEDGKCSKCSNGKIISSDRSFCSTIPNCLIYSDENSCLSCAFPKFVSKNKKYCYENIIMCITHSEDGQTCLKCFAGFFISADAKSCINATKEVQLISNTTATNGTTTDKIQLSSNTTIDKLDLIIPTEKVLNGIPLLRKNETQSMGLKVPTDYAKTHVTKLYQNVVRLNNLNNSYISLLIKVNKYKILAGEFSSDFKIPDAPTGYYDFNILLEFDRKNQRMLQNINETDGLPDYFTASIQSKSKFYVGNDTEIDIEKTKIEKNSFIESDNGFNYRTLAIALCAIIFLTIISLILGFIIWKKRKAKINKVEIRRNVPINVPIENSSRNVINDGKIDDKIENDENNLEKIAIKNV